MEISKQNYIWYLNFFMNINVTIERIDSCKLFNIMTKKIFYERKKIPFRQTCIKRPKMEQHDKLAYGNILKSS